MKGLALAGINGCQQNLPPSLALGLEWRMAVISG
jgi:hypothetical protein